ncbi:MAG: PEGA domain-containing protein [Rikenellaceae bacterium]
MKKILLLFILMVTTLLSSSAQQMSIESFKRLDNDLDARVTAPKKDQNGDVCAIIKVVTTQTGFTFNVGLMGITATVQKPGEIWVYVPQKVNRITISHPQLGVLRDYYFPIGVDAATCYELRLIAGTVTQIVEEDAGGQYFTMDYTPSNMPIKLYIDDEFKSTGTDGYVSVMLPYGKHTYRLEAIGYNNSAGSVTIGTEKTEIQVDMVSSVGYINIEADLSIKDDIDIYIDGELAGKAPLRSAALSAGEHTVQALSKYYFPFQSVVTVFDGEQVSNLMVNLEPNFARYSISNPDSNAKIYVNETYVGSGSAQVRLSSGMNLIELRKESHRTVTKTVDAVVGMEQEIVLSAPQPIYGTLQIESTPQGADIYLDGENVGRTPQLIKNTLIGSHTVVLKRSGYQDYTTEVLVEQSKTTTRDIAMQERLLAEVKITSTPEGAALYMNDKFLGSTPYYSTELEEGVYNIKVRKSGYDEYSSTITVSKENAVNENITLTLTPVSKKAASSSKPSSKSKRLKTITLLGMTVGTPLSTDIPKTDIGFMVGRVKRVGWYVSYSGGILSESDQSEDYYSKRWMANVGTLIRPASWLMFYGGVGYGSYNQYYFDYGDYSYFNEVASSVSYEIGAAVVIAKTISISCGYGAIGSAYSAINFGIGLTF